MNIKEIKELIETKEYNNQSFIINNYNNCPFLVHQYLHKIIEDNNLEIKIVDDVTEIPIKNANNFLSVLDNFLYVFYCDDDKDLRQVKYVEKTVFIYTGKKLKDILDIEEYIIDIPKIEDWQIKDYIYTRGKDVDEKDLDYLLTLTNDLFRLEKELDKIEIFEEKYRKDIFKQFIKDGIFDDLISCNTFDFIESVVKRKKNDVLQIYNKLVVSGINEMGIIALLYNNFRNIIKIQLSPNPSPENTDLKPNQFWAIKKNNVGFYSKDELLKIFRLLTDIDRKIKIGEIPIEYSIEYLLLKIL